MLEPAAGLEKSAWSPVPLLRKAHGLVRDGVWKTVAQKSKPQGLAHRLSTKFYNPVTDKSTLLSKGLTGYGFAGIGGELTGKYDLPGSNLALNTTMPGIGSLITAAPLISTMRAASPRNQARIMEDSMTGAREAAGDLLSLSRQDHRFATQPGALQEYIRQSNPEIADMIKRYRGGQYTPMSGWDTTKSIFQDSQGLINDRMDSRIFSMLNKSGAYKEAVIGGALRTAGGVVGKVFGNVLPWAFGTAAVGGVAHAALRDKPYDEMQAMTRGYAGAQAKMQNELEGLTRMQRFALRMDPTLMQSHIEKQLPGTIAQWERNNGQKMGKGWLANIKDNWDKPSETNFYTYDMNNQKHYL